MTRLWLMLGISLVLALVIEYRDAVRRHLGYQSKEKLVTWILIISMGFFCGLRIWGNDTVTYRQMFDQMPSWEKFWETFDWKFSDGIGYNILTCLIKSCGFSSQDYLMIFAFLTVIPYVQFVRRYSCNMVWGIFLMFATGFYTFSMAAIKQSLAIGICLTALPYALDRNWIRFSLITILASMFHPYAIVYFIVPLMMFEPWKGKTLLYIALFVTAGFAMDMLIGPVLDITTMMGAEYSAEEMLGEGVNIFRVAVCFVPLGLGVFFGGELFQKASRSEHLMFNLAMVNALIMFVGLFGTANYFARLANYFLPAQVVTLPWMIRSAHAQDRRWLIPLCIAGYTVYFYYENGIIRPFDSSYTQMSLWTYLSNLFG